MQLAAFGDNEESVDTSASLGGVASKFALSRLLVVWRRCLGRSERELDLAGVPGE